MLGDWHRWACWYCWQRYHLSLLSDKVCVLWYLCYDRSSWESLRVHSVSWPPLPSAHTTILRRRERDIRHGVGWQGDRVTGWQEEVTYGVILVFGCVGGVHLLNDDFEVLLHSAQLSVHTLSQLVAAGNSKNTLSKDTPHTFYKGTLPSLSKDTLHSLWKDTTHSLRTLLTHSLRALLTHSLKALLTHSL